MRLCGVHVLYPDSCFTNKEILIKLKIYLPIHQVLGPNGFYCESRPTFEIFLNLLQTTVYQQWWDKTKSEKDKYN